MTLFISPDAFWWVEEFHSFEKKFLGTPGDALSLNSRNHLGYLSALFQSGFQGSFFNML
jgi:hypothetical protein